MPLLSAGKSRFLGGGRVPWYRAGAAPVPVAAYQPKGAADLAASYVNLANPGTYNAAPGGAPTFDTATGWTFNGTTQWLTSGVLSAANMTVAVRYAGASGANRCVLGERDASTHGLYLVASDGTSTNHVYRYGASGIAVATAIAAGVLAIAGANGYLNGVSETAVLNNVIANPLAMYIGCLNANGGTAWFHNGTIQAIAIYSSVLTADQVAAVSAAMALL